MKISNDVLQVLSAGTTTGNQYFLPAGQLDRAMYTKVNKVLEAAGGKWNRSAKAHVFATNAENRMDEIILTGEVEVPKDEFEFFPTPAEIVEMMFDHVDIKQGDKVLEPSAGRGAIAFEAAKRGAKVDCYELMKENYKFLANNETTVYPWHGDFMAQEPAHEYDFVLMNPPFSKRQDIKHVNHAKKFLKEGGMLVAIMSAGVEFRQDKLTQEFKDSVDSIEKLPEGAFKSSGTMVNTVMVTYTKK